VPGADQGHIGRCAIMASVNFTEKALTFECEGEELIGIVAIPHIPRTVGVLVVVGGPQYRAGSHRQFVLLSRFLAAEGVAVLRFDYRGMGDATGSVRSFEDIAPDIRAAIGALRKACPEVEQVVLWGLCDGASAALTYWHSTRDVRLAGMILLNPWVRSEESLAKTHIKHYYRRRLSDREFWKKLGSGRVDVVGAVRSFARTLRIAGTKRNRIEMHVTFQDQMAAGLRTFPGPVLVVLSGRDLTAKEFVEYVQTSALWDGALAKSNVTRHDVPDADHTFSTKQGRQEIESLTLSWLSRSSFPTLP